MKIDVHRSGAGWQAYLIGKPGTWEHGANQAEAIGKLIITLSSDPLHMVTITGEGFDRTKKRPQFGSGKGVITMSEDFDQPMGEFREYQGETDAAGAGDLVEGMGRGDETE